VTADVFRFPPLGNAACAEGLRALADEIEAGEHGAIVSTALVVRRAGGEYEFDTFSWPGLDDRQLAHLFAVGAELNLREGD
jgi:hypothetical protein